MLLVVTRGSSVRPSDKHSFMVPFVAGDFMNDTGITFHSRASIGRGLVTVADVLNNHITDFCGAFFSVATWPHNYTLVKARGKTPPGSPV